MTADVHPETKSESIHRLPVVALCGYSGAGKTTLIERLIGLLRQRGLSVAVVKHDVHGLSLDCEGKDSDRFFRAGADVYMRGHQEGFVRLHSDAISPIEKQVRELASRYDIVLVEGHKQTLLAKVWLLSENETAPPADLQNVLAVLPRNQDRVAPTMDIIDRRLQQVIQQERLCGCILIGGKSTRMGRPKHLIVHQNKTWLERIAAQLEQVCSTLVIAGGVGIPEPLGHCPHLPDAPDSAGPLAGILSAMRWRPDASWIVAACDMPHISYEALQWLLSHRRPGVWAVIPKHAEQPGGQPLFAYYHARCGHLMADLDKTRKAGPSAMIAHPKTLSPLIPDTLAGAWRNINTPIEMQDSRMYT